MTTMTKEEYKKHSKNITDKQREESQARVAKLEYEQENPIEVTIKKKPKKPKKTVNPGKGGKGNFARGGKVVKMKDGGFPDLTGDGKVTQADVLKGKGVFKKGGSVNKKKIIRAAKRGFGAAKRGF